MPDDTQPKHDDEGTDDHGALQQAERHELDVVERAEDQVEGEAEEAERQERAHRR